VCDFVENGTKKENFVLKIKFKDYQKLVESATYKDSIVTNNKENRYKYLTGNFIEIFEEQLKEVESNTFEIQPKNYILNECYYERRNAKFIRVDGFCKLCVGKSDCKYKFIIPHKINNSALYVDVFTTKIGNHNHDTNKKVQLRGKHREKLVEKVEIEYDGSAKKAFYNIIEEAENFEDVPSVDVIRKAMSDAKIKKENINLNCIGTASCSDLISADALAYEVSIGEKFKGYIQKSNFTKFVSIICFMEPQFNCINKTPMSRRICAFDATGGLVKIPKNRTLNQSREYNRILNYYLILMDKSALNEKDSNVTLIGEMITSRHSTEQIKEFFLEYKANYERQFENDSLLFNLVIIDYSFASMHGILEALTKESLLQYANRVMDLAKGLIPKELANLMLWLASCCGHTMRRVASSDAIKSFSNDLKIKLMFLFSLLLNSTSLEKISNYFRNI
jgi:hypothetical protein